MKGGNEANNVSVVTLKSGRTLPLFSFADFVRDPETFLTASQMLIRSLDKAALSRRSPRLFYLTLVLSASAFLMY
ncbi:MAG: hypothetical protein IJQ39_04205 [Thermoguttaceae bacterium]|nr:hypothetical protein [Thermoguttaceae bacterium]